MHNNGRAYEWEDGFAPWQTDIATAPEWLILAIEELIRQHGGTGKSRERTASEAEFNSFGRRVDGRETYMADVVWAALIDRHREWDFPGTPPARTCRGMGARRLCDLSRQRRLGLPPDGTSRGGPARTRRPWLDRFHGQVACRL